MTVDGMNGIFANQSFPVDRETLIFGRSASSCNVVFPDNVRGISRVHCKVESNGTDCIITDLGSSYGTFVNGMKIQAYAPRVLRDRDTFYLGDKTNMFTVQNPNDVRAVGVAPMNNSVTYLNKGNSLGVVSRSRNNKAIIGVIVAAVVIICVIAGVAFSSVQQAETARMQAESELYEEQNKGFFGNLFDTVEDGIELIR